MRSTVAILGGISVLFVGFYGLSESAQQTKDVAVTNGTNATSSAYNATTGVFGGIGEAASGGIVWMGIAAIILVALGYLVVAGNSGR